MNLPNDLKYTSSHEWCRLEDDGTVTIGITEHAQELLGDVVFVETPEVDGEFSASDPVGVVESVKAASDIYAPVDCTVLDANAALADEPELINSDPYGDGWIYKVQPSNVEQLEELLSGEGYQAVVAEE